MTRGTFRIIDANLNRLGEGLRLLEDLARFQLDDAPLAQSLKTIRHSLLRGSRACNEALLTARDAEADVGAGPEAAEENGREGLVTAAVANSRRAQESLRVLEELAKVPGTGLDPERFKEARFRLYSIERELVSRLTRREKTAGIAGLYVVLDTAALKGPDYLDVAAAAIRGGAKVIQLRDKRLSGRDLLKAARALRDLCREKGVLFIVNDHLDIALASEADGLHVGQDDIPVPVARGLLPIGKLLGCSVTTVAEAVAAQRAGADYLGVGAVYPTTSKEAVEVVGLARLREIAGAVKLPVVAIGGVNRDNAAEVLAAGAASVAVISAVLGAASPEAAARELADALRGGLRTS